MTGQSSSGRTAWIIVLGILVCCVGTACCCAAGVFVTGYFFSVQGSRPVVRTMGSVTVGNRAPDFSVDLLGGGAVSLSDYRGRPVLVNFWATWCHYCTEEMPIIEDRYQRFGQELVILAVDEGESRIVVMSSALLNDYSFPILLDPRSLVGDLYGVDGYPMSFFIDRQGIVRYIANGMMEEADLDDGLASIGVK